MANIGSHDTFFKIVLNQVAPTFTNTENYSAYFGLSIRTRNIGLIILKTGGFSFNQTQTANFCEITVKRHKISSQVFECLSKMKPDCCSVNGARERLFGWSVKFQTGKRPKFKRVRNTFRATDSIKSGINYEYCGLTFRFHDRHKEPYGRALESAMHELKWSVTQIVEEQKAAKSSHFARVSQIISKLQILNSDVRSISRYEPMLCDPKEAQRLWDQLELALQQWTDQSIFSSGETHRIEKELPDFWLNRVMKNFRLFYTWDSCPEDFGLGKMIRQAEQILESLKDVKVEVDQKHTAFLKQKQLYQHAEKKRDYLQSLCRSPGVNASRGSIMRIYSTFSLDSAEDLSREILRLLLEGCHTEWRELSGLDIAENPELFLEISKSLIDLFKSWENACDPESPFKTKLKEHVGKMQLEVENIEKMHRYVESLKPPGGIDLGGALDSFKHRAWESVNGWQSITFSEAWAVMEGEDFYNLARKDFRSAFSNLNKIYAKLNSFVLNSIEVKQRREQLKFELYRIFRLMPVSKPEPGLMNHFWGWMREDGLYPGPIRKVCPKAQEKPESEMLPHLSRIEKFWAHFIELSADDLKLSPSLNQIIQNLRRALDAYGTAMINEMVEEEPAIGFGEDMAEAVENLTTCLFELQKWKDDCKKQLANQISAQTNVQQTKAECMEHLRGKKEYSKKYNRLIGDIRTALEGKGSKDQGRLRKDALILLEKHSKSKDTGVKAVLDEIDLVSSQMQEATSQALLNQIKKLKDEVLANPADVIDGWDILEKLENELKKEIQKETLNRLMNTIEKCRMVLSKTVWIAQDSGENLHWMHFSWAQVRDDPNHLSEITHIPEPGDSAAHH